MNRKKWNTLCNIYIFNGSDGTINNQSHIEIRMDILFHIFGKEKKERRGKNERKEIPDESESLFDYSESEMKWLCYLILIFID